MPSIADDDGIPFFPPFCVAPMEDDDLCTLFGITIPCHKAFSEESLEHFGFGLGSSHIWTFFITLVIGVISLWNLKWPWNFKRQSLKATCALYAIETSFFALIRFYWGVCKPLVAAAALHNLFEWSIVIHVAHGTTNYEKLSARLCYASLFIGFLITLCLCIPDLETALGTEMLFGIMLDFGIPLMFLSQLADDKRRSIYMLGAAAHTVHLFGTILPLVFAIFFSGNVSWFSDFVLEIAINLSVPITHFLYCVWSFQLPNLAHLGEIEAEDDTGSIKNDETLMAVEPHGREGQPIVESPSRIPSAELSDVSAESSTASTHSITHVTAAKQGTKKQGLLMEEHRIKDVWKYLVVGFFLGLIPLAIFPQVIMQECEGPPNCVAKKYVAKTSVATIKRGFEHTFEDMVASERTLKTLKGKSPGLLDVRVVNGKHVKNDRFYFVEKWKSILGKNNALLSLLSDTSMGGALAGGTVQELDFHTEVHATTCRSEEIGSLKLKSESPCGSLRRVLNSPQYCGWIPGCKHMRKSNDDSANDIPLLNLYMDDGSIIHAIVESNKGAQTCTILSQTRLQGYEGMLSLERSSSGGCDVYYNFRVPLKHISDPSIFYDDFSEHFVPDLYERLAIK